MEQNSYSNIFKTNENADLWLLGIGLDRTFFPGFADLYCDQGCVVVISTQDPFDLPDDIVINCERDSNFPQYVISEITVPDKLQQHCIEYQEIEAEAQERQGFTWEPPLARLKGYLEASYKLTPREAMKRAEEAVSAAQEEAKRREEGEAPRIHVPGEPILKRAGVESSSHKIGESILEDAREKQRIKSLRKKI